VPTNYKKNITSLFKEAIRHSDDNGFFDKYLADTKKNSLGPFTYSITIPPHEEISSKGKIVLEFNEPSIRFNVSSFDHPFITNLYNGLQKLNGKFSPFKHTSEFRNFFMQNECRIDTDSVLLKILSPLVLQNPEYNGTKKKGNEYLTCRDQKFKESLAASIVNLCRNFLNTNQIIRTSKIIIDSSKCSVSSVTYNNESIPATTGYIHINAPVIVLRLLYECGMGGRRNLGFGMVEVVG
jgi:CRISPR-associated endoribonuclease Cas6